MKIFNSEYLKKFLIEETENHNPSGAYVLPHEKAIARDLLEEASGKYDDVLEQKVAVSGGDDWHDGAFRATDAEANAIATRVASLKHFIAATTVGYPDEDERRVTLGSRLTIVQNGDRFTADMVGFIMGYPENNMVGQEEIIAISPGSPIGRIIMGATITDPSSPISFNNGGQESRLTICSINQDAVRKQFE
ncbi:MAG TPA: hypothetical protein PKA29_02320 [Candidatus Saccharibacteria bacterium]|nr:hypothetical protein [Candidatus Saccharibacteria bacterium]